MKGVLHGGPADAHPLWEVPQGCTAVNTPVAEGVAHYVLAGTDDDGTLRFDFNNLTPWS